MLKQGWVEILVNKHQKTIRKNEFLDYYEEIHN